MSYSVTSRPLSFNSSDFVLRINRMAYFLRTSYMPLQKAILIDTRCYLEFIRVIIVINIIIIVINTKPFLETTPNNNLCNKTTTTRKEYSFNKGGIQF